MAVALGIAVVGAVGVVVTEALCFIVFGATGDLVTSCVIFLCCTCL